MTWPRASMSEAEAAEVLRGFESSHRPYAFVADSISLWRLVRFPVGMALQNLPLQAPRLERPLALLWRWLKAVAGYLRLLPGGGGRYVVKTYVSALRLEVSGCYRDIYFDDLLESCPGGLKWVYPNVSGYARQEERMAFPRQLDTLAVQLTGAVLGRMFPSSDAGGEFRRLAALIEAELGVPGFDALRMRRVHASVKWQKRLYVRLLKRLKVGTVFVVDTGERALTAACRETGVRLVELQHGIFSRNHPDALPAMALEQSRGELLLPDVLAVYGTYWQEALADTALAASRRIVPVGAAMIDRYREYRESHFKADPARPVITLTTQGLDRDRLASFMAEFLSACPLSLTLNVKLHPAYDASGDIYAAAMGHDARVRILAGGEGPNTYELIATSDLHLSIASACHYDALGIGVPTVVLGLAGHELVSDLVRRGDAILASTPQELASIVLRQEWRPVTPAISDRYYRRGFVGNAASLIVPA